MKSLAIMCLAIGALALPDAFCSAAEVAPSASAPSASGRSTSARAATGAASKSAPTSKRGPVNSRVDLAVDVITGSSELPKVLYIVPWRAATAVPGIDTAPNRSDQQLFQSLDPDAHARLLHYRQLLGEHVAEEK